MKLSEPVETSVNVIGGSAEAVPANASAKPVASASSQRTTFG